MSNPEANREFRSGKSLIGQETLSYYANQDQRAEMLVSISRGEQILGMEMSLKGASGSIIEGLLSTIPVTYNEQPALLAMIVNITERREMEKELAEAVQQAEHANRFKGQFLANMSHEIRTPMNAIIGLSYLLHRTPLNLNQQDYLGKIQVSAQSLLNIIDDILDFTKIEAGELRIESIDFDLADILDNVSTIASIRLANKPVEYLYDIDPLVPARLHGDPHRLTQILTNLVGNATKFTDQGGIIVRVKVTSDDNPIQLRFVVEDTGIGIEQDKIKKLFEPFIQADGSTTREYGGTGLGLSICYQLTELMNGSISVQSEIGKGSEFSFQLPFGVASPAKSIQLSADMTGLRVLLVDDNDIARQILTNMLMSLTFRVDVVASGKDTLGKLNSAGKDYDLILLDWRMPGMDGFETAYQIRQINLRQQPKIIVMTAYRREAIEQKLDLSYIDGFLIKPITPSQLLDAIAQALNDEVIFDAQSLPQIEDKNERRLEGNVLLVEDNPINQQVAVELLQQMGLSVHVSQNGHQALNDLKSKKPDLVLMDIQMPDIDGYEVTRQIRLMPDMDDLPIIAMTANAMAGDAERSLDAGMNGHLAKPVDPLVLYDTLKAWLKQPGKLSFSQILTSEKTDSNEQLSDDAKRLTLEGSDQAESIIDFTQGILLVGGNKLLYKKLLDQFSQQHRNTTQQLKEYCAEVNLKQLEHKLHTLKGVSGNIGAKPLQNITAELEQFTLNGDTQSIQQGLQAFGDILEQTLQAIKPFVSNYSYRNVPKDKRNSDPGDRANTLKLETMVKLLNMGDSKVMELLDSIEPSDFSDQGQQLLNQLEALMRNYDFFAASEIAAQLAQHLLPESR